MKNRAYSIKIFLPDGNPEGLKILEKSNWTGRGVVCPRSIYADKKGREEFGKTGVYLLIGTNQLSDTPRIYIGEGDPVRPRIDSHIANKDFWNTAVIFTSKDDNLNKAHIQYLESQLVTLAREAKRCDLDNSQFPTLPTLSEMDIADCDGFLSEMLLSLPLLGISLFEKPGHAVVAKKLFTLSTKGVVATGFETSEGFVVSKDSQASSEVAASIHDYLVAYRKSLQDLEVLCPKGGNLVFTQDYVFNSPSTAAGVVAGRSINGRTEWRDEHGLSLKEFQEQQVLAAR